MENSKNIVAIEGAPEIPITVQEYASQNDVCPKTVERWFKSGKEVITVDIKFSDMTN